MGILSKLRLLSSYRTPARQEAMAVWQRGMVWSDEGLQQAVQDGRDGKRIFEVIAIGAPQGLHDHGHLSIFRALERHKVADHMAGMLAHATRDEFVCHGVEMYARWGHIEHKGFWDAAIAWLNQNEWFDFWGYALDEAALAGNLVPFEVCPADILAYRARKLSQLASGWKMHMVHPATTQWLVDKGLWGQADIRAQVNSTTCPIAGTHFMGLGEHVPCEGGYVADMCEVVLRDYALNSDQTIRFVGQALLALGAEFWNTTLGPRLEPYLGDVEINVLRAVCGQTIFTGNESDNKLYETVRCATQTPDVAFNAHQATVGIWEGRNQHDGLLFLMDMDPPKNRLELYQLAAMAMRVQRTCSHEPEFFELPSM